MFKIGEFSKISQVSIRMLRYYDEQGLLKPREVDRDSRYRMYTASQIEDLNKIVMLKNMGFSVKEIKQMLLEWNSDIMKENLLTQISKVKHTIEEEQLRLNQIEGYLFDLNCEDKLIDIQIVMKKILDYHVLSLRKVVSDYYCESSLWNEFSNYVKDVKNIESKQTFSIYHDLDYREVNVDIEVCLVCDHDWYIQNMIDNKKALDLIYRQVKGIDCAASIMIYGPYINISYAYKRFAYWLEQHKEYQMAGENRQICHVSMCQTSNPEEYITELLIPLKNIE